MNLDIKLANIGSSGPFEAEVLQRVKTGYLLGFCAICRATLVMVSILAGGHLAMWSMIAVGFFN